MDGEFRRLDPGAFLKLAADCGLELREVDLMQMTKRGVLPVWESQQEDGCYSPLHLYVVVSYLEAVRPIQHPWEERQPQVSVEEVKQLAADINELLDVAASGDGEPDETTVAGLFRQLRHFLGTIDPFGPLTEFVDLLKPSVIAKTRNDGRLYLEVKSSMEQLAIRLSDGDDIDEGGGRTRRLYDLEREPETTPDVRATEVIGEEREPEDSTRKAIDEVVSAADEASDVHQEAAEEADDTEDEEIPPEEETRPMQVIQVKLEENEGLGDESSDPIVLVDDEDGEVHLEEREEEESDSEPVPSAPPPSPVERREKFERQRQELTEANDWDGLVELFEEHCEQVDKPQRRVELLLDLGRIYEVKLREREEAFATFDRGWEEATGPQQRTAAFDEIQRLGKSSGLHDRYLNWLQRRLEDELQSDERARLHKELARGLFADQQFEPAFESYASFLMEAPDTHISPDTLNQLRLLGEHVEESRLEQFYGELRGQELKQKTRELVDQFAPAGAS